VALENLAWSDVSLLPRYISSQAQNRPKDVFKSSLWKPYVEVYQSPANKGFRSAVGELFSIFVTESGFLQGFGDAQVSDRALSMLFNVLIVKLNCRLYIHFKTHR
jgi:hypothetical protein